MDKSFRSTPDPRPSSDLAGARVLLLAVLAAALAAGWSGCPRVLPGEILGQVVRAEDGSGYGPVEVSLLDVNRLQIVAQTVTDDTGFFSFDRVRSGRYVPVVQDNERELFHLPEASYSVRPGRTVEIVLPMVPGRALYDFGLRLRGRVTDAVTGEPIENAIVETTHYDEGNVSVFSELWGRSNHLNQPTGADGRFELWPLAVIVVDEVERVPHVRVAHPGYRSAFFGGWRSTQVPQNLQIALEPGTDPGVITGTLTTLYGEPVRGLRVAVEWRRGGDSYPKAGRADDGSDPVVSPNIILPRIFGISDREGRFRIEGVPLGGFVLDPSYPRDDGWVGQQMVVVEVTETAPEADAGTLVVAPALHARQPLDGAVVGDDLDFAWDEATDAKFYRLHFRRARDGANLTVDVDSLSYRPPPGLFPDGDYVWEVLAFFSLQPYIELTRTERPLEFTVRGGSASAAPAGPPYWR